ncbi:MAG TPA: FAD-dependent monooxygenase [Bryobacteraceae bacterium]|nr:FAD-dependent monooxygenase [Bryobacteraceae bacterium]
MRSPRLLVIGGGIGGLATALAASASGCEVHVLEKADRFTEIGAGLQLAPNASRVLDALGILDDVRKHACFPPRLVVMDAISGRELTSVEAGGKFAERYGYPYFVVHRADLLDAEVAACEKRSGIALESGKEIVSIEDTGTAVRVVCGEGSQYEGDALVGADGLWSTVRKCVTDKAPLCSEFVAYRGTTAPERIPPREGLDNMTIWIGPDLHLVQYPLRTGQVYNQVAVFRSLRYRPGMDASGDWGTAAEFIESFAKTCDYLRSCVPLLDRYRRWPMYFAEPLEHWTRGRIALLGDAAHPMLQYIAQGACQALEDTVCLGRELQAHPGDFGAAFQAYEAARRPRTARVQISSLKFGEVIHVDGIGRALRNRLLETRAPDDFSELDWLYDAGPM